MNKIKVGDRVSARAFMGIESLGTVIYANEEQPVSILVKFDTWGRGHNGGVVWGKNNLDDFDEESRNCWWFYANQLVVVGKSDE